MYNFHLFIVYLDGNIRIEKIPWLRPQFYDPNTRYVKSIICNTLITSLQASEHIIYLTTGTKLIAYNLKSGSETNHSAFFVKEVPECNLLKIDYNNKLLFVFSKERGIVALDISDPLFPRYLTTLQTNIQKKIGELPVTNIELNNNTLFLSIRNFGIIRVDFNRDQFGDVQILNEINKIKLIDPQDVRFNPRTNEMVIIDSKYGLLGYSLSRNEINYQKTFDNSIYPQKLFLIYGTPFIQTNKGFVIYNKFSNNIEEIFARKIGAVYHYYNYIIFSEKGFIKLLKYGKLTSGEKYFLENIKDIISAYEEYILQ